MSAQALEALLARLYSDGAYRAEFDADPVGVALRAGLTTAEAAAVSRLDRVGLELAAESYGRKKAARGKLGGPT